MASLNSITRRERVLTAISHQQTDKVPIDFGGTRDSSIVIEGYEKLKKYFGIETEDELCDRMMRVVKVDERILQALDIDTRSIFPGPLTPKENLAHRKYKDGWGVERVHPESSYYFDQVSFPLSGEISISDILNYPWPDPNDLRLIEGLHERLHWIRENTDCASILTIPAPFIHISQYLRGFEDWFTDFIFNPKRLEVLFDAVLDINMQIARNELKAIGQEVDIVICADDLGTQRGLQISREHYLKYIHPRLEKYFRQIHDLSPAKLLLHSCGSIVDILDDLIEIGVDIINPVQVTAYGMDPKQLKKRFGKRIAFWGAMDTQYILPKGTVGDVKRMVEERIEQLGEGGGYVLSSCHNIQPDVPVENIIVMFQHVKEYVPSFAK